jgi:hypothetical protein
VKTSSPISRSHAVEHRATPRALFTHHAMTALWSCAGGVGRLKAATVGQFAGLWPSRPLWPWAPVRPKGIVHFFHFPRIYSNRIQIKFDLNLNMFKPVQT